MKRGREGEGVSNEEREREEQIIIFFSSIAHYFRAVIAHV